MITIYDSSISPLIQGLTRDPRYRNPDHPEHGDFHAFVSRGLRGGRHMPAGHAPAGRLGGARPRE